MQGWQILLTQVLVGIMVNAIIGILCWLLKREFLFFKRKMLIPQPLKIIKRKSNYHLQRPLSSAISLATASNTSPTIHLIKKKSNVCDIISENPPELCPTST